VHNTRLYLEVDFEEVSKEGSQRQAPELWMELARGCWSSGPWQMKISGPAEGVEHETALDLLGMAPSQSLHYCPVVVAQKSPLM